MFNRRKTIDTKLMSIFKYLVTVTLFLEVEGLIYFLGTCTRNNGTLGTQSTVLHVHVMLNDL